MSLILALGASTLLFLNKQVNRGVKMKYIRLLLNLLLICLWGLQIARADVRIVVYLRHAPPEILNQVINTAQQEAQSGQLKVKNIDKLAIKGEFKKILTPKLSGFTAIYSGYLDISNRDGLIQFPLRQVADKIYVAFTDKINLIKVKNNTFSHREFADPGKYPTKLYLYEKMEDEKKNMFWRVQEVQLPADNKISPLTIVIFTNPSNVFVKTGDFICARGRHMILPSIYVIDTYNQALGALNILKLKRFFEPINLEDKPATEKSTQAITTNV